MPETIQAQPVTPTSTLVDPLSWKDQGNLIPPANGGSVAAAPDATTEAITQPSSDVVVPATPEAVTSSDPMDSLVGELTGTPAAPVTWTDEARALFKGTFEAEDPIAFRDQWKTEREQYGMLKAEYDKVAGLKADMETLTPAMLRALELHKEGKDPLAYIKSLPDAVFQNKPSSELSDEYLCNTYAQGKTESAFATLKNPDSSEEAIEAAKDVIAHYRSIGESKHDAALNQTKADYQAQQQQQAVAYEQFQKGTAVALSNVKGSPLKAFVDPAQVEEFSQPGKFLGRFLESDGVTPKPDAFIKVIKGERFDEAVKAARTLGYKQGKEEGILEATSKLPAQPGIRREVVQAPSTQTTTSQYDQTLDKIQSAAGR